MNTELIQSFFTENFTWEAVKVWALSTFVPFVIRLLLCVIVFFFGKKLIKWCVNIIKKAFSKSSIDASVASFVSSLVKFILYALLIVAFLEILGIGTASVITLIGSIGLTIGLALQGSLSNFAGGVLMLILRPFKIGDYIVACGTEGTVIAIDIFYTKLRTNEHKIVDIPNGSLMNSVVTNVSADGKRPFEISVTVPSKFESDKVKQIIEKAVAGSGYMIEGEEATVYSPKYSAATFVVTARFNVAPDRFREAQNFLPEVIKASLDAEQIESSI